MSAVSQFLEPLKGRWQALAPRERALVLGACVVVALALLIFVGLLPAWRTVQQAPAQIEAVETQLQAMQRLAVEARELRGAAPMPVEQAQGVLKAATARLGDKGRLALQGDRAVLTLNGITNAALRDWMSEARSGARARPIEASITRGPQGLMGTLVVALGSGS